MRIENHRRLKPAAIVICTFKQSIKYWKEIDIMLAIAGYYDGVSIQPLEELKAQKNQRVIITIMDEFISSDLIKSKKEKMNKFFSLAGNINIDEDSVKDIREANKV